LQIASFAVADTGHGISAEDKPRLFEPYFSTKKSGTGLGLAIVYEIMQAHDGKVGVQSVPGQGSEFTVEFKQLAPEPALAAGAGRAERG
jgi:two-component system nitrogen regulation sensor histidine kinase NtrY